MHLATLRKVNGVTDLLPLPAKIHITVLSAFTFNALNISQSCDIPRDLEAILLNLFESSHLTHYYLILLTEHLGTQRKVGGVITSCIFPFKHTYLSLIRVHI